MLYANRRRHERFALSPMHTQIAVRPMDSDAFSFEGHAYDISEGGVQFELDRGFEPGTPIAMEIMLPEGVMNDDVGPGRAVFVMGNVVWLDDSEPGPVRMALAITRFARAGDRERLLKKLSLARVAKAA